MVTLLLFPSRTVILLLVAILGESLTPVTMTVTLSVSVRLPSLATTLKDTWLVSPLVKFWKSDPGS